MKMVHREEHNESYTVIDNAVLQNINLSWEARGFLAYLLSLPNDWCFTVRGIVKRTGSSKSVVLRLMEELKAAGYIKLERKQDNKGRFTQSTWHIYENPFEHHIPQKRNTVETEHGENGTRYLRNTVLTEYGENGTIQSNNNNKVLNIQSTNTNKIPKDGVVPEIEAMFDQFWAIYPKKVDKKGSLRAFKNIKKLKTVFPEIIKALEVQKRSVQWQKDNGQYIPNPTTYIHQERWNTVTEAETIQKAQDQQLANSLGNFSFWKDEKNA